jgi:hypothetical protein
MEKSIPSEKQLKNVNPDYALENRYEGLNPTAMGLFLREA